MTHAFLMPTRLLAGHGALRHLATEVSAIGARRLRVFTDAVIGATPFAQEAVASLRAAGLSVTVSDACGVDARLAQMEAEAAILVAEGAEAVVAVGGGSVMGLAKGAALAATNGGLIRPLRGRTWFDSDPLPAVMVPTTAGSGSEVSQYVVGKDDAAHRKFSVGGRQCFPRLAILDPAALATLPRRPAALAAVDALTHAVEAYFTDATSPVSDALALDAAGRLHRSLRSSILAGDPDARLENLIASSMANMACTNAGLGLCHSLSSPLEAAFDLPHGIGVAALLPPVFAFNAAAHPDRARAVAAALGAAAFDDPVRATRAALLSLYADLGLPPGLPGAAIDTSRMDEMAVRAVTALSRGRTHDGPVLSDTIILSQNLRPATVSDGLAIYREALA